MYTHILLPTDGSPRSEAAIQEGMKFAKSINAKVTGFHVTPQFHVFTYKTEMLEDTKGQFARDSRAHAQQYLSVIERAAQEAGVTCDTVYVSHDHPGRAGCSDRRRDAEGLDPQQDTGSGVPLKAPTFGILTMRPTRTSDDERNAHPPSET